MEPIHRQQYTLEAIHVDCFDRLKLSTLLYFSQEVAGTHCMLLNAHRSVLEKQNLFWAVIRHRVQITRLPMKGETITLETWPMPTTRVSYPRSTIAYNAQGEELFRSISLWVLMDTQTRAMILPGKSGVLVEGSLRGTELAAPGSLPPQKLQKQACRTVGYTELDCNGHMNNTRYMEWVDDLLPSVFHEAHPAKEFTICYLSEAREGQTMELHYDLSDGPMLQVDGFREKEDGQERVFAVRILY